MASIDAQYATMKKHPAGMSHVSVTINNRDPSGGGALPQSIRGTITITTAASKTSVAIQRTFRSLNQRISRAERGTSSRRSISINKLEQMSSAQPTTYLLPSAALVAA